MLNRNSAIIEKYSIGKYPFEDNIEIILSENRNLIIQQIAAWPDEISNIENEINYNLWAIPIILIIASTAIIAYVKTKHQSNP